MQKWEYKVIHLINVSDSIELLNSLGGQGWELVAVDEARRYFFKRPIN